MNISSWAYPSEDVFLVHQQMILKYPLYIHIFSNTEILYTIVVIILINIYIILLHTAISDTIAISFYIIVYLCPWKMCNFFSK